MKSSAFNELFNETTAKSTFTGLIYRIVESDLEVATMNLTDTLDEQQLIEQLLEETKPVVETTKQHYLLTTPFSYPPLKYGSRFGTQHMKSFFYGSKDVTTCLYECAYYRFLFFNDLEVAFETPLHSNHLLFSCAVASEKMLDLTNKKFKKFTAKLTHPTDYTLTQKIGQWALSVNGEENSFDLIQFPSARLKTGVNVAISTIKCIKSRQPKIIERIPCVTTTEQVVFNSNSKLIAVPKDVMSGQLD